MTDNEFPSELHIYFHVTWLHIFPAQKQANFIIIHTPRVYIDFWPKCFFRAINILSTMQICRNYPFPPTHQNRLWNLAVCQTYIMGLAHTLPPFLCNIITITQDSNYSTTNYPWNGFSIRSPVFRVLPLSLKLCQHFNWSEILLH